MSPCLRTHHLVAYPPPLNTSFSPNWPSRFPCLLFFCPHHPLPHPPTYPPPPTFALSAPHFCWPIPGREWCGFGWGEGKEGGTAGKAWRLWDPFLPPFPPCFDCRFKGTQNPFFTRLQPDVVPTKRATFFFTVIICVVLLSFFSLFPAIIIFSFLFLNPFQITFFLSLKHTKKLSVDWSHSRARTRTQPLPSFPSPAFE